MIMNLLFFVCTLLNFSSIHASTKNPSHASLIAHQIKRSLEYTDEKYLNALIQGIEARNNEIELTSYEKLSFPLLLNKKREIQAQKNLLNSEKWIKKNK